MLSNTLPAFGGDPRRVTLLGWGAGASLVNLLMMSPMTRPGSGRLFTRAVFLDGSALSPWSLATSPASFFFMLADQLKCPTSARKFSSSSSKLKVILHCLQTHSADNITHAVHRLQVPTFLSSFAPVVDGHMVPNQPTLSYVSRFGSLYTDIDLLVGVVSNPAHHLMSEIDLQRGVDVMKRDRILRTLVRNLYSYHRKEILKAIINEYTDWTKPGVDPFSLRDGLLAALDDSLFTAPLIRAVRMHASTSKTNTFMFVFDHEDHTWSRGDDAHKVRGSISGAQLPYLLGYPLWDRVIASRLPYQRFDRHDRPVSRVLMRYLSNFVKSGNPSKPVSMSTQSPVEERYRKVVWPQYSETLREPYLELNERPRIRHYYRNAQMAFWNDFVPELHKAGRQDDTAEEHHFLTDHFNKKSFFGHVLPHDGYANHPFPPPPLPPPTPPPKNLSKKRDKAAPSSPPIGVVNLTNNTMTATVNNYSTTLVVAVAVFLSLTVLNMCIFVGIKHQCDDQRKSSTPSSRTPHYPGGFAVSADGRQVALPSQTTTPSGGNIRHQQQSMRTFAPQSVALQQQQQQQQLQQQQGISGNNGHSRVGFTEQEPLLRSRVSPTCPRHGRTAAMAVASLEEIQV